MNFDDTPQEAEFRATARKWIAANAPREFEEELSKSSLGRIRLAMGDEGAARRTPEVRQPVQDVIGVGMRRQVADLGHLGPQGHVLAVDLDRFRATQHVRRRSLALGDRQTGSGHSLRW